MKKNNLQQLVCSLDQEAKNALQNAASHCIEQGGHEILIEDMLLSLLESENGFLPAVLRQFSLNQGPLIKVLQSCRSSQKTESQNPVFSLLLIEWFEQAFMLTSLKWQQSEIMTASLIITLLEHPDRYGHTSYFNILADIPLKSLYQLMDGLIADCNQEKTSTVDTNEALKQFTTNLTEQALQGNIDPVFCRDDEIRQMIDILARRRKNNPIIVGEAGVGKTAVVEGLALSIASGQVPIVLQQAEILSLDLGLLQAGASVKGEFERRLNAVIDEIKGSSKDIILFIDEAHTLIGTGNQSGGTDAANLLKPALARGELRTIAATTWSEYKKYFEKDPALARRFQPVKVDEPTIEQAVTILRGLAERYAKSHGVFLRDDAVIAAAELSARYLTGRQLPDKAVDVLDTACARVKISLKAMPESLQKKNATIEAFKRQLTASQRDYAAGLHQNQTALTALEQTLMNHQKKYKALEQNWHQQQKMAEQILSYRQQLASCDAVDQKHKIKQILLDVQQALNQLQQQQVLVHYEVCPNLVKSVIAQWTGIPLSTLSEVSSRQVNSFKSLMQLRIKGQDQAINALHNAISISVAGLNNPNTPIGVFLLAGPSGVGKTETARIIADLLYGGERFLTTINMSEFQEKHTLSRLIGSPPGYVGYGEGGVLTEAVRKKPYSVILLDEVEKADPDILNLFYQVFDKGVANDGEGREINFCNTLILLTTNLGSQTLSQLCEDNTILDSQALADAIRPDLIRFFQPALLARMSIVPYVPIHASLLQQLVQLKLSQLKSRFKKQGYGLSWSEDIEALISQRCYRSETGARHIDYIINHTILPLLSQILLQKLAEQRNVSTIELTLSAHQEIQVSCLSEPSYDN